MNNLAEMVLGDLLFCLARTGYVRWRNMLWGELMYDMIVFVSSIDGFEECTIYHSVTSS